MRSKSVWMIAIPVVVTAAVAWLWSPHSEFLAGMTTRSGREKTVRAPVEIAKPHLDTAEERIAKATRNHFDAIESLFARSRSKTNSFAKTALGWGSKWRIVADATPFTRGDRHPQYLKEQFESQVLSGDELTKCVAQAVTEFLAEIRSVESKMLVDLRIDIEDLAATYPLGLLDADQIQSRFDAAIESASLISGVDLQSNISSQLVSIIVGEVLTQVAVRLGVSAGILGAGAASGWATLGVGVIVGLIIDQIVTTIWNHWSDPTKNLEGELNYQLKVMQRIICYGDENTKGLEQHFDEIARGRAELRREAVLRMLNEHSMATNENQNK